MNKYSVPAHILSKTVSGEEILVDLNTGSYLGLNEVGTVMWNHLKNNTEATQIVASVHSEFSTTEEEITNDLKVLVEDLKAKNMLIEL